ncbi:MAG: slipin family protein [Planctomycetota bacterium]
MSTFDAVSPWVITLVAAGVALLALRARLVRVVVAEHEAVLVTRNGRTRGPLAAGVRRFFGGDVVVRRFDLRESLRRVGGQEVLTRDNVPVKFSVLVRAKIVDALRAHGAAADLDGLVHAEAQLALRDAVALFELAELLENRAALNQRVADDLRLRLAGLGVELVDAALQDVMVGGELKRALAEVVRARVTALAKLEHARGEEAALRKLVNAARLLREHEGLAELKKLALAERAAEGTGNTLVLGLDGPIPVRKA